MHLNGNRLNETFRSERLGFLGYLEVFGHVVIENNHINCIGLQNLLASPQAKAKPEVTIDTDFESCTSRMPSLLKDLAIVDDMNVK